MRYTVEKASIRQNAKSGYIIIWVDGDAHGVQSWQIYTRKRALAIAEELNSILQQHRDVTHDDTSFR